MNELPKAIEELKEAMALRELLNENYQRILNKLWPACCNVVDTWKAENRRTEPNEALTVVLPLTETELLQRDGKPVWRYQLDKGIGGWEIFTLDDDGNWYFVCSYLAQGEHMNKAIVHRVKEGRELLFSREVAPDMMERYRHKPTGSDT